MEKMNELVFPGDKYRMNWLRPDFTYAEVLCDPVLKAAAVHKRLENGLETTISITNTGSKPYFSSLSSIGIRFPLEDRYDSSEVCMKARCNTHIFCGQNVSCICALRMGGAAPHLGMVLTAGSLSGYSVERNSDNSSNDRGCFILHPTPMELLPGETATLRWRIFPHDGWANFMDKAAAVNPRFVRVEASRYFLFAGEPCRITITPAFRPGCLTVDGEELAADGQGRYIFTYDSGAGTHSADRWEKTFAICADGVCTTCRILVSPPPEELARRRCQFIMEHQQYHGRDTALCGAYLCYDNEEQHIFYSAENDYNAGRERVGMGLLVCRYLQMRRKAARTLLDIQLEESLNRYIAFVRRCLVNAETGEVCNDYPMDNHFKRLYNYPWYATLFVELYRLFGRANDLTTACNIIRRYYAEGGAAHYPIELPVLALTHALKEAGRGQEYRELAALFTGHADQVAALGLAYPPFEVNYEQSIVAPAASLLLQTYALTGEETYLQAGKQQLEVLALFNGRQPDVHLFETAIRHWDGYWFGKNKIYGDTFPHYWSALTGCCYALYAKATGDPAYAARAEAALRSPLALIFPDGSASCACLFPVCVNGRPAAGYDPYANDQDWALYFALREQA